MLHLGSSVSEVPSPETGMKVTKCINDILGVIFKAALLRYNLDTIKFTHLRCISDFLVTMIFSKFI